MPGLKNCGNQIILPFDSACDIATTQINAFNDVIVDTNQDARLYCNRIQSRWRLLDSFTLVMRPVLNCSTTALLPVPSSIKTSKLTANSTINKVPNELYRHSYNAKTSTNHTPLETKRSDTPNNIIWNSRVDNRILEISLQEDNIHMDKGPDE